MAKNASNRKEGITIGEFLVFLSPVLTAKTFSPVWPPDIFAVSASLLQKSGAYIELVSDWPQGKQYSRTPKRWIANIRRTAKDWRKKCVRSARPPRDITKWWKCVLAHQGLLLSEIRENSEVCCALLQLCAAADETCAGAGIPNERSKDDSFQWEIRNHLALQEDNGSTLCKTIHKSKLRVLPKLHTPLTGMTIRSISHHLALCSSGDVETHWYRWERRKAAHDLNLLLVPWPETISPSNFEVARGTLRNMPSNYGFFTYRADTHSNQQISKVIPDLLRRANRLVGRKVDGVILPELAINQAERWSIRRELAKQGAFLLCGIGQPAGKKVPGRNYLAFDSPLEFYGTPYEQPKQHRWLLDKKQAVQYGLGGRLDLRKSWWEYMQLEPRKLAFFVMRPWLTLCALICEDLARQDPVAEIVRAVGPNLVVALLMDGPQLPSRWSARYATVLADDPGSSVLTLTSIGMANLSRPPGKSATSRVIGLWKDRGTGEAIPIELSPNAEAIVLSLAVEYQEEWTADGRGDGGNSGIPVLGGIHAIPKKESDGPSVPYILRQKFGRPLKRGR